MIGAGLLAKKAVERGLKVKPYVKTSMAPGSRVVVEYLRKSNLLPYLEKLGFHVVGFGCTTCIGNSGPLPKDIEEEIVKRNLYVASVLSGNRNFEGRIHPLVKWNFLTSPPLVVAYAIAGRVNWDPYREPLDSEVYLEDIWPSSKEIQEYIEKYLDSEDFKKEYSKVFEGDEIWKKLEVNKGEIYEWDSKSTYIREPPFFLDFKLEKEEIKDIKGAYVLLLLGDRITTDHISPAGPITKDSPAALYLKSMGVDPSEFNTYGARRGNHEVMLRGAFTNPRLKNFLVDREGGWTIFIPTGEIMSVYDAAMMYKERGIPLIILAGKQYGAGSSRDWAAKATALLGIKAVIAESFERIHRSNLVGMGVLPLQFEEGENYRKLGLKGFEVYDIEGIAEGISPRKKVKVKAKREKEEIEFKVTVRLDNWVEVDYYKNGGIMNMVLREIIKKKRK
ncbi:Aconitate hydratase A [archaeon HR06]|nr:Aconitate hydratase A [archaeon HR06]